MSPRRARNARAPGRARRCARARRRGHSPRATRRRGRRGATAVRRRRPQSATQARRAVNGGLTGPTLEMAQGVRARAERERKKGAPAAPRGICTLSSTKKRPRGVGVDERPTIAGKLSASWRSAEHQQSAAPGPPAGPHAIAWWRGRFPESVPHPGPASPFGRPGRRTRSQRVPAALCGRKKNFFLKKKRNGGTSTQGMLERCPSGEVRTMWGRVQDRDDLRARLVGAGEGVG